MSGHTPGPLESPETLVIPVPAIKVLLELLQTVRMIEETAHMLLLTGETINHPPLEGKADCSAVPLRMLRTYASS
jgi:hypothetical protein